MSNYKMGRRPRARPIPSHQLSDSCPLPPIPIGADNIVMSVIYLLKTETYKLTYFNITSRGEPCRLLLHAVGQIFKDERVPFEDWPKMKQNIPWGKLPILEVGENKISQSLTICRFISRRFGLCPQDHIIAAKCDEIVDATNTAFEEYARFTYDSKDKVVNEEKKKLFLGKTLKNILKHASKFQEVHGNSWYVGNEMTWSDIVVSEYIRQMTESRPEVLDKYPNIKAIQDAVNSMPKIQRYRESFKKRHSE